jgi:hypothetical protein
MDNIMVDLREIEWSGVDLTYLAQARRNRKGSFKSGNEPSGSIICWEVLELLNNWQLLKNGSAPWRQKCSRNTLHRLIPEYSLTKLFGFMAFIFLNGLGGRNNCLEIRTSNRNTFRHGNIRRHGVTMMAGLAYQ